MTHAHRNGFTLIELSIVLVIIGLIVGGILVGQDLIKTAEIRQQITQIEQFQTAEHVFEGKYNCMPGDCKNAANFGFPPRGANRGQGDGNWVLEALGGGLWQTEGENVVFWVDLSMAKLIAGSFTTGSETVDAGAIPDASLPLYFPIAKIGGGNYIFVYSDHETNFYTISAISPVTIYSGGNGIEPGLTVSQAFAIDTKMDDGFPQTGTVLTQFPYNNEVEYPQGVTNNGQYGIYGTADQSATAPSAVTCYDNSDTNNPTGSDGAIQHYSMNQNGGNGVNCALSFKFQ